MDPHINETAIQGVVAGTLYYREDTGFRVVSLFPEGSAKSVVVAGILGELEHGESVKFHGSWTEHQKFGRQFKAERLEIRMPETQEGIEKLLGSGMIHGIGPKLAQKIVNQFGRDTLDVIEKHPGRLAEVKGLGAQKRTLLVDFWKSKGRQKELLLHLANHGIGLGLGHKIQKHYGDSAMEVLRNNPYQLAREIKGVGFQTADQIALRMGMDPEGPERIRSCITHVMTRMEADGHCHVPRDILLNKVAVLFELSNARVIAELDSLLRTGELVQLDGGIQSVEMYNLETSIIGELQQRLGGRPVVQLDPGLLSSCLFGEIQLSQGQFRALEIILSSGFSILSGGPGVGKTTLLKILVKYFEKSGFSPVLAAPTGRAAQRMEEATGRPAGTMHRLLKFDPAQGHNFGHDKEYPLEGEVFIIDEFSMVDVHLFNAFLRALPMQAQVVLVGDRDQLPSVGPGRVLADMLEVQAIPRAMLDQVFRQSENSILVGNSHRILRREFPLLPDKGAESDFYFIEAADGDKVIEVMDRLLLERIPLRFGGNAMAYTQVLSPMKKGSLGTHALNRHLQGLLNPDGEILREADPVFRRGDKVIQLVNNYEVELFNGDLGVVTGRSNDGLHVRFGTREIAYPPEALDDLALAYACTVHKAQGSEYPVVLMPIMAEHRVMLSLELLYTALTRARKLCVWVGRRDVLESLLAHPVRQVRNTFLAARLGRAVQGGRRND